eukprot:TRINITY_DN3336_c0_g1_i3.p1 TRINITY_DN3336_c0_g1~~TRINITY_DN3336_c0_g1_i3.p1  ORF type:complete len:195 (+),score=23.59 TRINITY_DN3336_c0_g1_i3:788-1372(+)
MAPPHSSSIPIEEGELATSMHPSATVRGMKAESKRWDNSVECKRSRLLKLKDNLSLRPDGRKFPQKGDEKWKYFVIIANPKAGHGEQREAVCSFCGFVELVGTYRIRHHLLGTRGKGIAPCNSCPENVSATLRRDEESGERGKLTAEKKRRNGLNRPGGRPLSQLSMFNSFAMGENSNIQEAIGLFLANCNIPT